MSDGFTPSGTDAGPQHKSLKWLQWEAFITQEQLIGQY